MAGLRLAAISLAEHPDRERFVSGVLRQRADRSRLPDGGGTRAPAAGGPRAAAEDLDPGQGERAAGGLPHRCHGFGARPCRRLEEANALVSSIDAGRSWFRYHHLFADLLRLELRRTDAGRASSVATPEGRRLVRGARRYPVEAIGHAHAAGEWSYAAGLLGENYVGLILDGRLATVHGLLAAFPPEAPTENAELAIALAGASRCSRADSKTPPHYRRSRRPPVRDGAAKDQRWRFDLRLADDRSCGSPGGGVSSARRSRR